MDLAEIGRLLRETREQKHLTLEDIQANTKIRHKYLAALEAGDESAFPATVYLKGFLRTYANELGLDGWQLVEEYNRHLAERVATAGEETQPATKPAVAPAPGRPPRPTANRAATRPLAAERTGDARAAMAVAPSAGASGRQWQRLAVYLFLGLVVVALAFYGYSYLGRASEPATPPGNQTNPPGTGTTSPATPSTATGENQGGGQTAFPTVNLVGTDGAGSNATSHYVVSQGPITATVRASGRCWLHVEADQKLVFEGTLSSGETASWTAAGRLYIRAGDPGAISIVINGVDIGQVGQVGIPRNLEFIIK